MNGRNPLLIVLLSALVVTPLAAAAAPVPDGNPWLGGELDVRARYVYGLIPCDETVTAILHDVSEGASVPEQKTLALSMPDSACGPKTLTFDAQLQDDGSWSLGDGETTRGTLRPSESGDGAWDFHFVASTCPPGVICEFPLGQVTYSGTLGGIYTTQ